MSVIVHIGLCTNLMPSMTELVKTVEGDLVRTAWVITNCSIRLVPDLAIAVESARASRAVHVNSVATEDESSGLALVAHGE